MGRQWIVGVAASAFLATVVTPQAASAEADEGSAAASLLVLLTTTGLIALAGIGSYAISSKDSGGKNATRYLRENAADLRQGIALGSGPVVEDLVAAFGVPTDRRSAFARELRVIRSEILSLADPATLTDERAWRFFERVKGIADSVAAS